MSTTVVIDNFSVTVTVTVIAIIFQLTCCIFQLKNEHRSIFVAVVHDSY